MNNAIALLNESISQESFNDSTWLKYFDWQEALRGLHGHIANLESDSTPEQYTRDSYLRGIWHYIQWAGGLEMRLPTEQVLMEYVAYLKHDKVWYQGSPPKDGSPDLRTAHKGVSSATIASSYLAPLRIFLKKLIKQVTPHQFQINSFDDEDVKSAKRDIRDFIIECKEQMRVALSEVKNPRGEKTNISALWNPKFNRLEQRQVNKVSRSFDRSTIVGARDYCLFRLGVTTGFRVAELQRITMKSFGMANSVHVITVRGKRSNFDPVPITNKMYKALMEYVEMYNAPLDEDDPRRIGDSNPIFQPMRKGGKHPELGNALYDAQKGLSKGGIRDVIKRVTKAVLDIMCSAHDLRRTYAAIAFKAGMAITRIQAVMRHADAGITLHYIGTEPNHEDSLVEDYVMLE